MPNNAQDNHKDLSGLGNKTDEELTIEDLKPRHKKSGYPKDVPKWYIRMVEFFPGIFTWILLLSPFWATLIGYPEIVTYYITFLTIFWSWRAIKFIYGLVVGYNRMQRDMDKDWLANIEDLEALRNYKPMKYVLIFPVLNEIPEIFFDAIKAWSKQDIGPDKISIVFALEKKYAHNSRTSAEKVIKKYGYLFRECLIYEHRNDVKGEIQGVKGANINWATRHFVREIQQRSENPKDYLLITNDSDYIPHHKYLSAITSKFFTLKKPYQKYFTSAVYKLTNKMWDAPILVRTYSSFLSLAILQAWVVEKHKRDSFSAYVVNLQTVIDVGYWDPAVGIDDTTFYWNSKIHFNGDFRGEEVYLPASSDAIRNTTTLKTYKSLAKQQHRWGSGVISFSIALASLHSKKKQIPRFKKFFFFWELFDQYVMFTTVVFLLSFALPILSWLSPEYNFSTASVLLPKIMGWIFTALGFLNIPIYIYRRKILLPPKSWSIWRILIDIIETFLISINMLTFSFIPFVQAQTELLLGKGLKKEYYATERVKKD